MKPSLLTRPTSKMPTQHDFAMARFQALVTTLLTTTPAVPKAMRDHATRQHAQPGTGNPQPGTTHS